MNKEQILLVLDIAINDLRESDKADPERLAQAFEAIREHIKQNHQSITISPNHPKDWSEVWEYVVHGLGLTDDDARYLYNNWKANGFTRNGKVIKDWKAAARAWKAGHFYPSQKVK